MSDEFDPTYYLIDAILVALNDGPPMTTDELQHRLLHEGLMSGHRTDLETLLCSDLLRPVIKRDGGQWSLIERAP